MGPSLSVCHQLRGGKGKAWNGGVYFCLEPTVFKLIFDGSAHPWCI